MFSVRAALRARAIHGTERVERRGLVFENGGSGKPLAARQAGGWGETDGFDLLSTW